MGTSAGSGGTSGPATPASAGGAAVPAGAGGAAVPAGTTGNATEAGATGGSTRVASIHPVKTERRDNPLNEQENPEADDYIAKGKAAKKERIEASKRAAQEGAEPEAKPVAVGKQKGRK